MCSSPPNPTEQKFRPNVADHLGTATGAGGLCILLVLLTAGLNGVPLAPPPGEVRLVTETRLRIALVPMPSIAVPLPEPVTSPLPEPIAEPEPSPEIVVEPEAPVWPRMEPEPAMIPPPMEAVPSAAAQPQVEEEGAAGREEAIRAEWMVQLRRRIERSKFYPGAARVSRETGTVLLQVEILPSARIGEVRLLGNTGSALLAEGALAILHRAAEKPLGTNRLSEAFQVEVPITYQARRR